MQKKWVIFMRHQKTNKNNKLQSFYLRMPEDLIEEIQAQAQEKNISKAAMVVELCRQGLRHPAVSQDVSDWLQRNV